MQSTYRRLQAAAIAVVGVVAFTLVSGTGSALAEHGSNHPPVASDDSAVTISNVPIVIDVLANDSDPDGDVLRVAPGALARNAILAEGPVLLWECSPLGGGVVLDHSGFGGTGTIGGGVTTGAITGDCDGGAAFLFPEGTTGGVIGASASLPTGSAARTVLVRFRSSLEFASVGLFGFGTNEQFSGQFSVTRSWNNNELIFTSWGNDVVLPLPPGANMGDGQEHTIAVTYDGGTTLTAYFDGAAGTPVDLFVPLDTQGSTVVLGQAMYSPASASDQLRQLAVFSGALSEASIQNIHAAISAATPVTPLTQPANGTVTTDGFTVTYTPNPGFFGVDTFTYTASDANTGTDVATVTVTVTAGILANPDNVTVTSGEVLVFNALANDFVPEGITISIVSLTTPSFGEASTDGTFITYTPNEGFVGTDTFQYTIESNEGNTSTGLVTVTVQPANQFPVAVDDFATTLKNEPIWIDVLGNDSDPDGDFIFISPGALAREAILREGPLLHWECLPFGGASILNDNSGNSRHGVVSPSVTPGTFTGDCDNGSSMVFAGPGVVSLANPGLPTGSAARSALVRYKANQAVAADIPLFGYGLNGEPFAQFSVSRTILGNDKLIFTSWANDLHFELPDGANIADGLEHTIMFVYDGNLTVYAYYDGIPSGSGTLGIPLNTVDDTVMLGHSPWGWQGVGDEMRQFAIFPTAIPEENAYLVHAAIEAAVLNRAFTKPRHGDVIVDPDFQGLTYVPDPGYSGTDQFLYSMSDGMGGGAVALVSIIVDPGVESTDDDAETSASTPVVIDVLANDTAMPGAVLSISTVTQPSNGVTTTDGLTVTYTPNPGFLGIDTFTYTAVSDLGSSDTATVTVVVTSAGLNQPPVAEDDFATTTANTPVSIAVLANDSDPDGDALAISAGASAVPGILAYDPVMLWSCLPVSGSTVFDQSGNDRNGTVSGNVVAGPEAPDCGTGSAMKFLDGTASVSRLTPGLPEGNAPRSVMLRYRSDIGFPADLGLFGYGTNGVGLAQFSVQRTGFGHEFLYFASWGNDTLLTLPAGTNLGDGSEHTIVVVYDGNVTLTAYVDGVAGAPATLALPLNTGNDVVMLGQTLYGAVSAGAEVRHFTVFDVALDATQVADLHDVIENSGGGDAFTQPANGTVTQDGDELVYTPDTGFVGVDTFTYTVSDGKGGTATATVTVTVTNAANQPPVAEDDFATTTANTPVSIAVLANDSDPDGDALAISAGASAVPGILAYDPVMLWSCLPVSGSTVFDQSGNDRFGTVSGNVVAGPEAPDCGTGSAMKFLDGTASVSRLTPGLPEGNAPRSVMLRYRSDIGFPADLGLFGYGTNGVGLAQFSVQRTGFGHEFLYFASWGNDTLLPLPAGTNLGDGSEHTIVVVYDGNVTLTAYVDGVAGAPATLALPLNTGNDVVMLGQTLYGAVSAGAEVRHFTVFDVALDATQVADLHDVIENGGGPAFTQPADGTVTQDGDELVYTPNPGFSGVDTFFYSVSDGNGGVATATVTVTVLGNNPPEGDDIETATAANTPVTIDVLGGVTDPEGDDVSIDAVTQGANGTVAIDGGNVVYTPAPGFTGTDTFTVTVVDEFGGTLVIAVTVVVSGSPAVLNVSPLNFLIGSPFNGPLTVAAAPENNGVPAGGTITVTFPAGTTFGVGASSPLTWPVSGVTPTSVSVSGTTVTITLAEAILPGSGFQIGPFSPSPVTFGAVSGTIDIVAGIDSGSAVLTLVGATVTAAPASVIANGIDAATITIGAAEATTNTPGPGLITIETSLGLIEGGVAGGSGTLIVVLHAPPFPTTSFTAALGQGELSTGTSTVLAHSTTPGIATISVYRDGFLLGSTTVEFIANGAPEGDDIETTTAAGTPVTIDVLGGVTDPEGDDVSIDAVTQGANGTVAIDGGSVVYTPAPGFIGIDTFTVTVVDIHGGELILTVTVTVATPLIVNDDAATTQQGQPVDVDVLDNDQGDGLAVTGVTQGANGSVSTDGTTVTYTPDHGFHGSDSFEVTVEDVHGNVGTSTVSITVEQAPFAAVDDSASTSQGQPVDVDVLDNDTGTGLTVTGVTQGANGSVSTDGTTVTYTPDHGFHGSDSFEVTLTDVHGNTGTSTVSITVAQAPFAVVDDTASAQEGQPVTITVLDNDTGTGLTVTGVTQGANGSVTTDGITVTYTPAPGFYGTDTFTVTVTDAFGNVGTSTVTVTVVAGELIAVPDAFAIPRSSQPTILDVLANDSGTGLTVVSVTSPGAGNSQGTTAVVGGQVQYTPRNQNFTGTVTFSYTVMDAFGRTDSATVTVTVGAPSTGPSGSGRMTGGGNVVVDGARYSFGLTLRCSGGPNNFQFNDHSTGVKFHLQSVTSVQCLDDPAINPLPRPATFDTMVLTGTGRLGGNGPAATVELRITDQGEPGRNDTISVIIRNASGQVISQVSGTLTGGNIQAHH